VCQQGGRGDDQETGKKRAGKFHDHVISAPGIIPQLLRAQRKKMTNEK